MIPEIIPYTQITKLFTLFPHIVFLVLDTGISSSPDQVKKNAVLLFICKTKMVNL